MQGMLVAVLSVLAAQPAGAQLCIEKMQFVEGPFGAQHPTLDFCVEEPFCLVCDLRGAIPDADGSRTFHVRPCNIRLVQRGTANSFAPPQ